MPRLARIQPLSEGGSSGLRTRIGGDELNRPDDPMREIAALRERFSRLSEASLHITEDLDLDAVLQGILDRARSLTGARMGGITILDDSGQLQDFITSGLTDEDHQRFVNLPGGPEFFAYLSSLPEPLRLADFSAHTTALGLPEIGPPLGPVGSFLGAPIRLRGVRAGNLYLSDKEGGGEFTQDDEETLAMFASHAAMAIANARRHREEQRASAYLETLIDTTPVGVVVFNAVTGVPVSLNREGRRLVDGLTNPGQTAEQFLDVLTFRRADGREILLREFPLAEALSTGGKSCCGSSPWRRRSARARRCGPRRSSSASPTAGASACCSTPPPSARRRDRSSRWSSPSRT